MHSERELEASFRALFLSKKLLLDHVAQSHDISSELPCSHKSEWDRSDWADQVILKQSLDRNGDCLQISYLVRHHPNCSVSRDMGYVHLGSDPETSRRLKPKSRASPIEDLPGQQCTSAPCTPRNLFIIFRTICNL